MIARTLLLASALTLGALALPAHAEVSVSFEFGVPSPPVHYEVIPATRQGYVWTPGYWQWNGRRHVWVEGHWVIARTGPHWVQERWERPEHTHYRFAPGYWEREYRHHEHERDRGRHHHRH